LGDLGAKVFFSEDHSYFQGLHFIGASAALEVSEEEEEKDEHAESGNSDDETKKGINFLSFKTCVKGTRSVLKRL
jgi:hypothetical protein